MRNCLKTARFARMSDSHFNAEMWGGSGHTAERFPRRLEQDEDSKLLSKSCCSCWAAVPKIDVEPHPRGRFGPAHPEDYGERVDYPNHLQSARGG